LAFIVILVSKSQEQAGFQNPCSDNHETIYTSCHYCNIFDLSDWFFAGENGRESRAKFYELGRTGREQPGETGVCD
jgi:hypothetical protein